MKKLTLILALLLLLTACKEQKHDAEDIADNPATEYSLKETEQEDTGVTLESENMEEKVPESEPPTLSLSEINALGNDAYGWGFVKKPGAFPEFTAGQIDMMEKYSCIYEGNKEEKCLYLTFDEGYENGYTASILDTLKEKGVKAAFFITGPYLDTNFDLIKRMLDEGHIVGNHTVRHPNMPSLGTAEAMQQEITELDMKLYETFGVHTKYFRPPEGAYSERSLAAANAAGYKNVLWSFAYRDWETKNQKGAAHAVESVVPYLHNGCVMLLHAVSQDNAEALGTIIDEAKNQGYTFKSLDEFDF